MSDSELYPGGEQWTVVESRYAALADNLSGFIPSEALGSPKERAAAKATSDHWERTLRAVLGHPEGEAMSTANDACREWIAERTGIAQSQRGIAISEAAFLAGYRRALEDAAAGLRTDWFEGRMDGRSFDDIEKWLRDRADRVDAEDPDNTTDRT